MSIAFAQLGARRRAEKVGAVDSAAFNDTTTIPLSQLRPGMTCRVVEFAGNLDPCVARRLFDLGFAPGGEVSVLRKAPMGDPVIFGVAEYEVALRKTQTAGIRVRRTS